MAVPMKKSPEMIINQIKEGEIMIDKKMFKAYDVRGIYPEQLNKDNIYQIARAYVELIRDENPGKELKIVVGQDMRLSSPELAESAIKGIIGREKY